MEEVWRQSSIVIITTIASLNLYEKNTCGVDNIVPIFLNEKQRDLPKVRTSKWHIQFWLSPKPLLYFCISPRIVMFSSSVFFLSPFFSLHTATFPVLGSCLACHHRPPPPLGFHWVHSAPFETNLPKTWFKMCLSRSKIVLRCSVSS